MRSRAWFKVRWVALATVVPVVQSTKKSEVEQNAQKLGFYPRYNFLDSSIPYDTSDEYTLTRINDFMNDVLSYHSLNDWKRILDCDDSKSLLCAALITDNYIASENIAAAMTTITHAYEHSLTMEKTSENDPALKVNFFFADVHCFEKMCKMYFSDRVCTSLLFMVG